MVFKQQSPLILVADDDKWTRSLLRLLLQPDKYRIIEVENAEECLIEYAKHKPDIVLLDAIMPQMSGFDCCRQLKSLPGGDRTPVLMITGLNDGQSVDRAFEAGATDFVTKPIHAAVLRQRLRYLLATISAETALRESEEKYRSVVENLQEVIFKLDTEGRFTFLNPAWTRMTGFSQTECLGKRLLEFIYPEDRDIYQQCFRDLVQHYPQGSRFEVRYLTESGYCGWMEVYACLNLADDQILKEISGSFNDITERKERERHQKVQFETARVLAESTTLKAAILEVLFRICESLEWDIGEFWEVQSHSHISLHLTANWCSSEDLNNFCQISQTITFDPHMGLPGIVLDSSEPLWMVNVIEDANFQRQAIAQEVGLKTAFGFPIVTGDEKLGVMTFLNRTSQKHDANLIKVMSSIGRQIGQFMKRKQAEEELKKRNELLQLELNQAAEYVSALLPSPFAGSISIEQRFIPSAQLGGDVFDYYWLDENHLAIYLLDVAGHGVSSALLSVSLLNIMRTRSLGDTDFYQPQAVLRKLNSQFKMDEEGDKYFTIWYGVFDVTNRKLVYAAAGHPPGILLNNSLKKLSSKSLPIGIIPGFSFTDSYCEIPNGSTLYIFSDGIYEIIQADGNIWGVSSFIDLLEKLHQSSSPSLERVLSYVKNVNHNRDFDDDLSILKLTFS